MYLKHLNYILKVAELGSITKASNELYISQPSLTKAILSLEREYNIKIFERTKTGIAVTVQGKQFINYAKNVVLSAESLEEAFRYNWKSNQAQLSVASQKLDFIPQVFLNMYNKYNTHSLEFELFESHRHNVILSVQKGDCNLGLLVQTNKEAKAFDWKLKYTNLEVEYLDSSDVYVIVGPKSKLYNNSSVTFKDVEELPHICIDFDNITKVELKNHSEAFHINFKKVIFCNSFSLCKQLLQNTDMILFASKWILSFFKNSDIKVFQIKNNMRFVNNLIYIKRKYEPLSPIETQFLMEVKKTINVNAFNLRYNSKGIQ